MLAMGPGVRTDAVPVTATVGADPRGQREVGTNARPVSMGTVPPLTGAVALLVSTKASIGNTQMSLVPIERWRRMDLVAVPTVRVTSMVTFCSTAVARYGVRSQVTGPATSTAAECTSERPGVTGSAGVTWSRRDQRSTVVVAPVPTRMATRATSGRGTVARTAAHTSLRSNVIARDVCRAGEGVGTHLPPLFLGMRP